MNPEVAKLFAAGLAVALGGIMPALAQGTMVKAAMEAAGRNPSVKDDVFSRMIIAMALTESIAIYSLVIALLILFV
jgi:F-type H+-transporting ATPase subunit c